MTQNFERRGIVSPTIYEQSAGEHETKINEHKFEKNLKIEIESVECKDINNKETEKKIKEMAQELVKAFDGDPGMEFISNSNKEMAEKIFEFLLRRGLATGKIYAARDSKEVIKGVAVWAPPPSYADIIKHAWRPLLKAVFNEPKALRNFFDCLSFCSDIEEKSVPSAHLSLCYIGVDSNYQGSGLGSALMEKALSQIDNGGGQLCYLELLGAPEKIRKLADFYGKFGFEPISKMVCYREKEKLYHMAMTRPIVVSPAETVKTIS